MEKIIFLGDTMHEIELALLESQRILKNNTIPFKHIKHKNELTIFNSIKIIGISINEKEKLKYYTHKKVRVFNAISFLMIQDPNEQLNAILGR